MTIHRTPGRHGHGELAEGMGPVSRFVFESDETVYVAGDTIWYEPVQATLDQFDQDEPITMGIEDITAVREASDAEIVVHMETINHCLLSREELRAATEDVHVREDGEQISL